MVTLVVARPVGATPSVSLVREEGGTSEGSEGNGGSTGRVFGCTGSTSLPDPTPSRSVVADDEEFYVNATGFSGRRARSLPRTCESLGGPVTPPSGVVL